MKRMFNKKVLVVLLIILVVMALVIIFFMSGSKEKSFISIPPTSSPTSDNNTIPKSKPENKKSLTIVSSTVPNRLLGIQEGFVITFSQIPSTSELFYEITPDNLITMSLKDKSIYISPYPKWKADTQYEIVVKSGTKDIYGNLLNKTYEYSFKTVNDQDIY